MLKNNRYNDLLVSKDLEYSKANTNYIDKRVWKVCEEAGSNYEKIQKAVKQKDNVKQFDIILEDRTKKPNCEAVKLLKESVRDDSKDRLPVINKYYQNESSSFINLDDTFKEPSTIADVKEIKLLISNGNDKLLKSNGFNYTKKKNEIVRSTNQLFKSNNSQKQQDIALQHNHKVGKACMTCELKKK
jgi:hypothetical protein